MWCSEFYCLILFLCGWFCSRFNICLPVLRHVYSSTAESETWCPWKEKKSQTTEPGFCCASSSSLVQFNSEMPALEKNGFICQQGIFLVFVSNTIYSVSCCGCFPSFIINCRSFSNFINSNNGFIKIRNSFQDSFPVFVLFEDRLWRFFKGVLALQYLGVSLPKLVLFQQKALTLKYCNRPHFLLLWIRLLFRIRKKSLPGLVKTNGKTALTFCTSELIF